MIFVCTNPDCPEYNIQRTLLSNSYKYIDGKLVSKNAPCPVCGKIREERNPNDVPLSEKNVDLLRFDMKDMQQKRELLKKRSHEHFKKEIEPQKRQKLKDAVQQFKEAGRT